MKDLAPLRKRERFMLLHSLQLWAVLIIIFSASLSYSAVIFSDNFDNHPTTCHTGGDVPYGWSMWYENDISTTRDSITHYAGEIGVPGRGGTGKSLKIWRHSDWPAMNHYSGGLRYDFPADHSNIFVRYYQKIPIALTLFASDYLKSWRFNTTGGYGEIYLNFRVGDVAGDMRTLGTWGIFDGNGWTTVLDNAGLRAIWDGNWHCIEFQLGLDNSTLRLWVDGVLQYSNPSYSWSATGYFDFIQHFAIGNVGDGSAWQNSWQAIEFDDLVISTTYVGPGDFVPPSQDPTPDPSNSSSGGGGGCFIATAAFGSPMAHGVKVLRQFRDAILVGSELGRIIVTFYQKVSPPIADYIAGHDSARFLVRLFLLPLIYFCWMSLKIGSVQTLLLGLLIIVLIKKRQALSNMLQKSP